MEPLKINAKINMVLEKYPSNVTMQDIEAGLVKPIEVIDAKDSFPLTNKQIKLLKEEINYGTN